MSSKYTAPIVRGKTAEYCRTLGVARNSSKAKISAAYRRLAKAHHPDRNPDDPDAAVRFKAIHEAFEFLHGGPVTLRKPAEKKRRAGGQTSTPPKRRKRKHYVPPKPYPTFPLTPHCSGKWMKKIKGRLVYFGRWGRIVNGKMERLPGDGWEEAYAIYKAQAADLHSGREPDPAKDQDVSVKQLCNLFLTAMYKRLQAGRRMSPRMFADYRDTAQRMCDSLGKNRQVRNLRPLDFTGFADDLAKYGPHRRANEVQRTKTILKWGVKNEIIEKGPNYGSEFVKPGKDELRKHRAETGKKLFTREEIHAMPTRRA